MQKEQENIQAKILVCIITGSEQVKRAPGGVVNHSDSPLKKNRNPLFRSCL